MSRILEIMHGRIRSTFYTTLHMEIGRVQDECNVSPAVARRLVMSAMAEILAQAITNTEIPEKEKTQ